MFQRVPDVKQAMERTDQEQWKGGGFILATALMALAAVGGCATPPSAGYSEQWNEPVTPESPTLASVDGFSFSTDKDRQLVRETRKLLPYQDHDYLVGPDDVLEISVFEWDLTDQTRTLELRVSKTGVIALPALGAIPVAGKSVEEINDFIVHELGKRNILQNPRVAVSVKEYRNRRISVVGAVQAPGVYALQENVVSLMEILSLAGGPAPHAAAVAYVQRLTTEGEEAISVTVDLDQLFRSGDSDLNPILRRGDSVYVPSAPQVFVYGMVGAPGAVAMRRPTTVIEAIALAGGFDDRANTSLVTLVRRNPDGRESIRHLNVSRMETGASPNVYLREGDVLRVPTSESKAFLAGAWDVFSRIFSVSYRLNSDNN